MPDRDEELAEAARLMESGRFNVRLRGFEILRGRGEMDLVLAHALKERDMRVLDRVGKWFSPKPKKLVGHLNTVVRGVYSALWLRYDATRENYQYAEDAIYPALARKKQLTLETIEAIGLARLRSCGGLLQKYLNGRMITYKDAREQFGPAAVAGVTIHFIGENDGSECWSRESNAALESAVALARLDVDFDVSQVERMLTEIPVAMTSERYAKYAIGPLKWVLFDKGITTDLESLFPYFHGVNAIGPDLATTLLKRNRIDELRRIIIRGVTYDDDGGKVHMEFIGSVFAHREFCYWPLVDWLEREGLYNSAACARHMAGYIRARDEGHDPPEWWQWLPR